MSTTDEKFFTAYVAHHWAASKGGLDLFRRAARSQSNPEVRTELARLADQVAEDRAQLRGIADSVGVGEHRLFQMALSVGETIARAKPNGTLVRRSPLSDVFELEALLSAVHGKRAGWQGMRVAAESDGRLDAAQLERLIERADDQLERLSALHDITAAEITPPRR